MLPSDSSAHSFRPNLIPNGNQFSCANCHLSEFGGGARNAFGQAVEARVSPGSTAQFWDAALAALDSDGDGVSNGAELQDPNGTWRPGSPQPGDSSLVTNPGDRNSVNQPAQTDELPVSLEDAGLTRIVPDTVVNDTGTDALGNWEAYTSVLSNEVFLIEANTFVEGSGSEQRYVVQFQKVTGGNPVLGEAFFSDDGQPYRDVINFSRQNGNPGRVAGDKRPGAVHFIAGGEVSLHALDEFNADGRWDDGVDRDPTARFGGVQVFSLDKNTLQQTPTSNAIDPVFGLGSASGFVAEVQMARFGGDVRALSNGNFLVVVEDRSRLFRADGNAASAAIIAPDGSVVKSGFMIAPGDLWSNVAAYKGGFCVRVAGFLMFYDNDGNFQGEVDQHEFIADRGRGDGTRVESHINSDFVFLSGFDGLDSIRIVAYDARTQEFVTETNVNELTPDLGGTDEVDFFVGNGRVEAGVDALNRIAVTWNLPGDLLGTEQVVCRVMAFDGASGSFSYLTSSFLPFVNSGIDSGMVNVAPSCTMTTKEIIVSAKGRINLQNDVSAGPDSSNEVNYYTVFSHPDPQDDPTTPVSTATLDWALY